MLFDLNRAKRHFDEDVRFGDVQKEFDEMVDSIEMEESQLKGDLHLRLIKIRDGMPKIARKYEEAYKQWQKNPSLVKGGNTSQIAQFFKKRIKKCEDMGKKARNMIDVLFE